MNEGLSEREVRRKLKEHGPNRLRERKKVPAYKILIDQFCDILILILLVSTAISALMGETVEAVTIAAIILLNGIMGFVQEYRTEKTLDALKDLAAPTAKVIRGGKSKTIAAEELVPGDMIIMEAGDRVPADAILMQCNEFLVDESLLTGESLPVAKIPGHVSAAGSPDRENRVFMGTAVSCGNARALVNNTGMNTEMGKIADMIAGASEDRTPLQKRLDHLGTMIAIGCIVICAIVSAVGILKGEDLLNMLISGISLAVAAVPEGLPAIVTVSLALGVRRMLRRNALVRRLPAVETLGCATVICSDKTGTLTENRMMVRKIFVPWTKITMEGRGYNPEGSFLISGSKIDPFLNNNLRYLLEIGCLCNNSALTLKQDANKGDPEWTIEGDPTEGALLVAAARAGILASNLDSWHPRIAEIPFSSERRRMSTINRRGDGEAFIYTKGAPDVLLNRCDRIYTEKGILPLDDSARRRISSECDVMASEALRLIAVAYKRADGAVLQEISAACENGMIFAGVFGMIDPPRKEAFDAVRRCNLAGIRPVMITGDHRLTACAIAKELGILRDGGKALTGREIDNLDKARFERLVANTSVYARVSPSHKLMIVKALKNQGNIVAMTGDGVNDAPAVKEADIGISMGISGTDVTREASSMILMDDNFATIVAAIEEGRVIYGNIRKFIRYMLACNIGEVLTMFIGSILNIPLPLMPIQILWVNLVTDGLPAVALGLDPPERDIMRRPPRSPGESIFSHGLANMIIFRGIIIGFSTLSAYIYDLNMTGDLACARTVAFTTLVATQLVHVFECKSETRSIIRIPFFNNILLVISVLLSIVMMVGVIYIPVFQEIFKTVPIGLKDWLLIFGFTAVGPVLSTLIRPHLFNRR